MGLGGIPGAMGGAYPGIGIIGMPGIDGAIGIGMDACIKPGGGIGGNIGGKSFLCFFSGGSSVFPNF